jgi:hypothetical protein
MNMESDSESGPEPEPEIYRQSVHLSAEPLEAHYQRFGGGGGLNPYSHTPYITSSLVKELSVGQLNCCWPSPARSLLASVSSRSMTKIVIIS